VKTLFDGKERKTQKSRRLGDLLRRRRVHLIALDLRITHRLHGGAGSFGYLLRVIAVTAPTLYATFSSPRPEEHFF